MRFVIEFYNSDCLILSCFDNDDLVHLSYSDELTFPYVKFVINTKIDVQHTKFKVYIENIKNKVDVFYTINDANDKVLKIHHVGYNTTPHDISPIEFQNNTIEHDQIVYEFNDIQDTVVFYVRNVKYPAIPFEKYPTFNTQSPPVSELRESQFTAPESRRDESQRSEGTPDSPKVPKSGKSPKVPEHDMQFRFKDFERLIKTV